ncbi:hypothetical protein FOL47_004168 [Perkinsus chesapeaki]|uniref:Uncharacterized protein n=1 Tax=Perkinsus chesapeaki TaxID=330153 RepID=A0A7J6M4C0_PERCH|nr:hypothetical protein FOL47_004168 [Perkinsus chesapeaki]
MPSLVQLCHSGDGTPQTGLQFKTSQALKALAQKRIDSKKAKITDGEERKAREANVEKQVHSREKLGDGEDLVARAMREAGSNEEASLENEESPTPHKLRRPSRGSIGEAKSVIDGGKSPQPGNDMTANSKGASGDSSNVKELDYTKPSSSRIDTKKDEDGEAEGRGDGRSEVGRRSDGLKILGAKASGDVFGTFNDLSNRSMVSPDDPGSPQLTSYTFDDLLDEWDRY